MGVRSSDLPLFLKRLYRGFRGRQEEGHRHGTVFGKGKFAGDLKLSLEADSVGRGLCDEMEIFPVV